MTVEDFLKLYEKNHWMEIVHTKKDSLSMLPTLCYGGAYNESCTIDSEILKKEIKTITNSGLIVESKDMVDVNENGITFKWSFHSNDKIMNTTTVKYFYVGDKVFISGVRLEI